MAISMFTRATSNATLLVLLLAGVAGCASPAGSRALPEAPHLPPPQRSRAMLAPVVAFPEHGQSAEQQSRDRYDCYLWAVQQSGFDPTAPRAAPSARVERRFVRYGPPRDAVLANDALNGAIVGAVVSRDPGHGAAVGAIAALILGAIVEERSEANAREVDEARRNEAAAARSELAAPDADYLRALSACLSGRGYEVR